MIEVANLATDAGSGFCGVAYAELGFFSGFEHCVLLSKHFSQPTGDFVPNRAF